MFPNPAINEVAIDGKIVDDIQIIDLLGRERLHQIKEENRPEKIDISTLENGLYHVITMSKGITTQLKIK